MVCQAKVQVSPGAEGTKLLSGNNNNVWGA